MDIYCYGMLKICQCHNIHFLVAISQHSHSNMLLCGIYISYSILSEEPLTRRINLMPHQLKESIQSRKDITNLVYVKHMHVKTKAKIKIWYWSNMERTRYLKIVGYPIKGFLEYRLTHPKDHYLVKNNNVTCGFTKTQT